MERLMVIILISIAALLRAGYILQPSSVEEFIGITAEFECRYSHAFGPEIFLTLSWTVNDTLLNRGSHQRCNLMASTTHQPNNILISRLQVTAARECNQTEVQCVVAGYNFSNNMTIHEPSLPAILYVQDIPMLEKAELHELNGTILVDWDPLTLAANASIFYQVELVNDRTGEITPIIINRGPNSRRPTLNYSFNLTQGYCTTFTVYITPVINQDFSAMATVLVQEISPINALRSENVSFFQDCLQYMFYLDMRIPFCIIQINATNEANNETYLLHKARMESGSTDTLMFRVSNTELPFDEHYTAILSLGNYHSMQTVQSPIHLSTYDIQNVSREESHIVVTFVHDTNAQGAFIVCRNNSNSQYSQLSYIVEVRDEDTIQLEIIDEGVHYHNDCDILVYDIENSGLLKGNASLKPALQVQEQVCITGCELSNSYGADNGSVQSDGTVSVSATPSDGAIRFECNISAVNHQLLGCIAIIHNETDFKLLLMNKIHREKATISIDVRAGRNYFFAVFEWKKSGILDSRELLKGTLFVDVVPPNERTESDCLLCTHGTDHSPTITDSGGTVHVSTEVLLTIIIITVIVVIVVVIIIIIVAVILYRGKK